MTMSPDRKFDSSSFLTLINVITPPSERTSISHGLREHLPRIANTTWAILTESTNIPCMALIVVSGPGQRCIYLLLRWNLIMAMGQIKTLFGNFSWHGLAAVRLPQSESVPSCQSFLHVNRGP